MSPTASRFHRLTSRAPDEPRMTIRYTCAECGAVLNIKDELAGTQGHCPRCQVEFTVPVAEGSTVVETKPAAVAGESSAQAQPRPAGGLSEDDIGALLAE